MPCNYSEKFRSRFMSLAIENSHYNSEDKSSTICTSSKIPSFVAAANFFCARASFCRKRIETYAIYVQYKQLVVMGLASRQPHRRTCRRDRNFTVVPGCGLLKKERSPSWDCWYGNYYCALLRGEYHSQYSVELFDLTGSQFCFPFR